jgi:hypothetical protein
MDKYEAAARRGEEAQQLLMNPVFEAAFTDTRTAVLEALASLDNVRSDQAQDLHRMLKCLERVKRCINEHVTTGKLARKEIEGRAKLFGLRRA